MLTTQTDELNNFYVLKTTNRLNFQIKSKTMNSITIIRTSAPPTPPAVTVLRVAGFSVQESVLLPSVNTEITIITATN